MHTNGDRVQLIEYADFRVGALQVIAVENGLISVQLGALKMKVGVDEVRRH